MDIFHDLFSQKRAVAFRVVLALKADVFCIYMHNRTHSQLLTSVASLFPHPGFSKHVPGGRGSVTPFHLPVVENKQWKCFIYELILLVVLHAATCPPGLILTLKPFTPDTNKHNLPPDFLFLSSLK